MIKCIILDFDGPIFDGRAARAIAYAATVRQFSGTVGTPDMDLHGVSLFGPDRFIALMYAGLGLTESDLHAVRDFYVEQLRTTEASSRVAPEVLRWLGSMKQQGFELAILTGRSVFGVNTLLDLFGIQHFFELVVGRDSVAKPKPAADPIHYIADKLGLQPAEVLMVGDSDIDYQAAVAAGVQYCHAGWSDEPTTVAAREPGLVLRRLDDLADILTAAPDLPDSKGELPADLAKAIAEGDLGWFAGAGVSLPSGLGSWETHYRPLLDQLRVGWLTERRELPELLQLACTDPARASEAFDAFKASFGGSERPNAYHFAILRSLAERIWTSNYDQLFERAIDLSRVRRVRTVRDDGSLLNHFRDSRLVIKVNGDFESASYRNSSLDWGVVATQEQFDKADGSRREIWRLFEDDYRNRSLVFVGVSIQDPILRRVIALAASRVPRTRYPHYLLARTPDDPAGRALQAYTSRNLERYGVRTLTFGTFTDLQSFVSRVALGCLRPIVGISGCTLVDDSDIEGVGADDVLLPNGLIAGATLRTVNEALGQALAVRGYRVSSGCAPYVGREAVNAAFEISEKLGRFYLRKGGTMRYQRTAPAVIVRGGTYEAMRERFIGEVSVLIAMGGIPGRSGPSGVIEEIRRAIARKAPVILIPQVGGEVTRFHAEFMAELASYYVDARLAGAVRTANEKVAAVPASEIVSFIRSGMLEQVESVLYALVEANTDAEAVDNPPVEPW